MRSLSITERLQAFYTEYKFSMARITVENNRGDLCNGACFHIGEGFLVTARHVIEGGELRETVGYFKSRKYKVKEIILPDDPNLDLAILRTDFSLSDYMAKEYKMPPLKPCHIKKHDSIPISWYLSSMVGREIELTKVLLFGYPIIPRSSEAHLVAATGEINAFIKRYDNKFPHFIVSVPPKGGYSGGPVISESGHVIGVVTESLCNSENHESGFLAVIAVDVLLNFLGEKKLNPEGYDEEAWFSPDGPGYKKNKHGKIFTIPVRK